MKVFQKEQKVIKVKNVEIGGQPGEHPVVMIGSLFYKNHKACKNLKTGEIDKEIANKDVNTMLDWNNKTGIPIIFDLIGQTSEALENYIRYVSEIAPNIPFLVDGLSDESRIPAMRKVKEMGLLDCAILNSIDHETKDATLAEIKEIGVKYSVLLTFEKLSLTPDKKMGLLLGKEGRFKGLLQKASEAGVKDFLVDCAVLDLMSLGFCAKSQELIKEQFGFPVGCAPSNAIFEWEKGKELFGKDGRVISESGACVYLRDNYADFILYGAAMNAPQIFSAMAPREAIVSYYQKRMNKIDTKPGPFNKII
jgi:tetrahydromethanopterin S-methyltransferase subunit H